MREFQTCGLAMVRGEPRLGPSRWLPTFLCIIVYICGGLWHALHGSMHLTPEWMDV